MQKIVESSGFWVGGADSRNDPAFLGQTSFAWGINGTHRGGIFRTRPGYRELLSPPSRLTGELHDANNPQGLHLFKPLNSTWYKVMAHGGLIYKSKYPFTIWEDIPGLSFWPFGQIIFEVAQRSTTTNADGSLAFIDEPYPVLMIQDGVGRAGFWDGTTARHLSRNQLNQPETPTGQTMIWNSQRLWVGSGNKLHASNLGDPLTNTEELVPATGGFFTLPDDITAIAETPDLQALLAFTDKSTETFQSAILDRTTWKDTPGFQKQLFRNIGCVGPKAWVNQYGITYWYSHNGIVELDTALQTYRTRRLRYASYGMSRSQKNLHKNLRGVCAGSFENFLFFSVPSGDRHNAHTWVMDETSFESTTPIQEQTSSSSWAGIWTGIRPVEWVTEVINGIDRCFALSRDYPATPSGSYRVGIWEAFCPQRADVSIVDGSTQVKRITCGFEARQMVFTADPKKITAIEADCSEIVGEIDPRLFFNGRRSGFTQIGSKMIVASEGSLGGPLQPTITDTDIIGSYMPQQRLIRSNEILIADPQAQSAQSRYIQSVDRGFGVYLEWDGEMAVNSVRIFADVEPELQLGRCEENETTARIVDWTGKEQVLTTPPIPAVARTRESAFVDSISQRFVEPHYTSR